MLSLSDSNALDQIVGNADPKVETYIKQSSQCKLLEYNLNIIVVNGHGVYLF